MVEILVEDVCLVKPFREKLSAEIWLNELETNQ